MASITTLNPSNLDTNQTSRQKNNRSPSVTPMGTPAHFLEDGMLVVDPLTRKMVVPYDRIYETRAFQRGSVPSLCMLFQSGRCRQGAMCYQVHADPSLVHSLRSRVPQRSTCCIAHGNAPADLRFKEGQTIKVSTEESFEKAEYPVTQFAVTHGLRRALEGAEASICRAGAMCRFGDECKFLHMCREIETSYSTGANQSPPSYPTTPIHTFQQDPSYFESPTLGASMGSIGNGSFSLPGTPLQYTPSAQEMTRVTPDGSWLHDPYQWRCLAVQAN